MKMREQHIVPLSRQAVELLRELQVLSRRSSYLFPALGNPRRPMSENTVNAALRRLGYAHDEMTGHGFRSMASTLLNEQGWHPDLIELQLAHAERNKVRAAYNRAQRLVERRRMMQAWADYLVRLKEGAVSSWVRAHPATVAPAGSNRSSRGGGTLLLGQSFLSHLPSWSIDNRHGLLVIADAGSHGESQSSAPDSPDSGTLSSTVQGQPASADDFDRLSACLAANAKSPEAQRLTMLGFLGGGKRTLVQLTDEHIATMTDSRVAVTYLRNNDACSPFGPLPPDRFKKILLEFSNGILSYGDTNLALVKWRQDLKAAATRAQEQEQKCMAVATTPRDRLNCINIAEKESAVD
jgi:hypothetical protein